MVDALKEFFSKYATFSGRTSRKTYWLTILGLIILGFLVGFVCGLLGGVLRIDLEVLSKNLSLIISLVLLIPSIALDARRLHDINKSGWWQLICLVPVFGSIILLVFLCLPSVNEENKY